MPLEMYNSDVKSEVKQQLPEKERIRKKMSKAEMQLAIIKKKQCDAKALIIVEQLLEPNIDANWLLQNLVYINKNHLEDVIEERAITKLCGYVLCNNPLTVIISQQYHISTRKNKVYDVSKRKNYCSSHCFGASNYLLEQMLTSPLWLREKEELPIFRILPLNHELLKSTPGDEVNLGQLDLSLGTENAKEFLEVGEIKQNIESKVPTTKMSKSHVTIKDHEYSKEVENNKIFETNDNFDNRDTIENKVSEHCNKNNSMNVSNTLEKNTLMENHLKTLCTSTDTAVSNKSQMEHQGMQDIFNSSEQDNSIKSVSHENVVLDKSVQSEGQQIYNVSNSSEKKDDNTENSSGNDVQTNNNKVQDIVRSMQNLNADTYANNCTKDKNTVVTKSNIDVQNNISKSTYELNSHNEQRKHSKNSKINKHKLETSRFCSLAVHVEENVKEWFTEDTICLLVGEANAKQQLIENLTQHEKYVQLCKKLNRLQLQDEKADNAELMKNALKPLPQLSKLQEEGEKMQLKVRAFYKGSMIIDSNIDAEHNDNDNSGLILPLTDAHGPKALRRRIFLDKLNKILPDLLLALAEGNQSALTTQYIYNSERCAMIKLLVSTFALSAKNIVFKTAEWTLVGLLIIKLLSIMDHQLKVLLATKQASMYISMILMSYKLDSNYLDKFIIELTNIPHIFNIH